MWSSNGRGGGLNRCSEEFNSLQNAYFEHMHIGRTFLKNWEFHQELVEVCMSDKPQNFNFSKASNALLWYIWQYDDEVSDLGASEGKLYCSC